MCHCQVMLLYTVLRKSSPRSLQQLLHPQSIRHYCKNEEEGSSEEKRKMESFSQLELPEEPTNCCMSGCANCVWIEYAKELQTVFHGSNEKARDIILTKISDPNMKAFLAMELKMLEKE
nr:PREDICTED: uncharacterized protein LOC109030483 [Bemisia tabaci]